MAQSGDQELVKGRQSAAGDEHDAGAFGRSAKLSERQWSVGRYG